MDINVEFNCTYFVSQLRQTGDFSQFVTLWLLFWFISFVMRAGLVFFLKTVYLRKSVRQWEVSEVCRVSCYSFFCCYVLDVSFCTLCWLGIYTASDLLLKANCLRLRSWRKLSLTHVFCDEWRLNEHTTYNSRALQLKTSEIHMCQH